MIQNIEPLQFNNQYTTLSPKVGDKVFCFWQGEILISQEDDLEIPSYEQVQKALQRVRNVLPEKECQAKPEHIMEGEFVYLFSISGEQIQRYFLLLDMQVKTSPKNASVLQASQASDQRHKLWIPGFSYQRMFATRERSPKKEIMAASTAFHLYQWYQSNRYCGVCGKPLEHDRDQRMLYCSSCGNMVFPKIAPAVIVGVFHQDRLLLTRYAGREYKRYALVAGFTEIGETPEETVSREVLEEVGLRIKDIHYYASQPWGFDSNLLLGYFAQLEDSEEITLDTSELATAEWVERGDVPDVGSELSLTGDMMKFFTDKKEFTRWWDICQQMKKEH